MTSILSQLLSVRSDPVALEKGLRALIEQKDDLQRKVDQLQQRVDQLTQSQEDLFQIDATPNRREEEEQEKEEATLDSILFETSLDVMTSNETADAEESKAFVASCFNCLGAHNVSECTLPRDRRAIDKNRREFKRKCDVNLTARYHVDEEQKFNHLKPGSLPSEALRQALGLRSHQLPSYIYRMRQLGYPPAWRKAAEIRRSGVNLILSEGKILTDDTEDGEVDNGLEIDIDKYVEWPGFNAPMPEGVKDESRNYRCGPLNEKDSKDNMLIEWGCKMQKGYVRGKMHDTSVTAPEERVRKATPDSELKDPDSKDSDSPKQGQTVKSVSVGTPIVSTFSPYENLPSQSQWAKDTTDHILFENLPDSTGKWDQMLDVIKKGRKQREEWEEELKKEKNGEIQNINMETSE